MCIVQLIFYSVRGSGIVATPWGRKPISAVLGSLIDNPPARSATTSLAKIAEMDNESEFDRDIPSRLPVSSTASLTFTDSTEVLVCRLGVWFGFR
jgi:hypothetical protein